MRNKKHLFHFIVSESMNANVIDFLLKSSKLIHSVNYLKLCFVLLTKKSQK